MTSVLCADEKQQIVGRLESALQSKTEEATFKVRLSGLLDTLATRCAELRPNKNLTLTATDAGLCGLESVSALVYGDVHSYYSRVYGTKNALQQLSASANPYTGVRSLWKSPPAIEHLTVFFYAKYGWKGDELIQYEIKARRKASSGWTYKIKSNVKEFESLYNDDDDDDCD